MKLIFACDYFFIISYKFNKLIDELLFNQKYEKTLFIWNCLKIIYILKK